MKESAAAYALMAACAAEAGLLAAQAEALMRQSHRAESVPFFLRAIEIDPNFAAAYTALSRIYSNLGEAEPAKEYAWAAYQKRDQVGTRERLSITYQYHYEVTGDQLRANETLEEWKQSFPLEFQPANSLALIHNFLGDFDRAIEEGREAVKRNPFHGYPYSNLAHAYRGKGLFCEARQTAERAVALEIETLPTRQLLYQLALIDGDEPAAARQLEWARDRPREFDMIGARAQAAGWSGRVREARQLYEEAAQMAERRNLPDVGTSHLAWASSMELAYGNTEARGDDGAPRPGSQPRVRFPITRRAGAGDDRGRTRGGIDRQRGSRVESGAHVHQFDPRADRPGRHRTGTHAAGAGNRAPRGRGSLRTGIHCSTRPDLPARAGAPDAECGSTRSMRIPAHSRSSGTDPFSPFHVVALLGLARAHAAAGDVVRSRNAYATFLAGWTSADPAIPVLVDARQEYERLGGAPHRT